MPTAYASEAPGGNISDPVVRAVDIAKPAVVRIITQVTGKLTVNFSNGQSVTFPLAPEDGVDGYGVEGFGSGAFISAHGDILTADHVINPVQDERSRIDQIVYSGAAPDVARYINQNLQPAQPATADQVTQELTSGQLQSSTSYQPSQSWAYLSTDFSGPLSATQFEDVPKSQFAAVDKVKEQSPFSDLDLAVIHVSGMDNMPMLQLGDSSSVQQQDQLTIIGFPANGDVSDDPTDFLTSSVNQIYVSAIKTPNGAPIIQVGGNVEQGDSGGPALDSNGQVVGVVSFGIEDTVGSTSFLRSSNNAKQLIQAAGINTTPSAFQQAWSQAFNDYASTAPGHWHQSTQEFQQIARQYPNFKALNPFLQYASEQAKTETQTQEANTPTPTTSSTPATRKTPQGVVPVLGSGGMNTTYIFIGGGVVVVLIILISGLAISRRRKPAAASTSPVPATNGTPPPNQPGASPSQAGFRPQAQPSTAAGMAAFGAPQLPITPQPVARPPDPDATFLARPKTPAPPQWRIWPCGHVNRDDARFCRTCGEPSPPPPTVRRVEQ